MIDIQWGEWIEWNGIGDCPVPPLTPWKYRLRDGCVINRPAWRALSYRWSHFPEGSGQGRHYDIVAYCVALPALTLEEEMQKIEQERNDPDGT